MLANLRLLFGRLIDIALLRAGPETLPASPGVLAFAILLNATVSVLMVVLVPGVPAFAPLELIVSIVVPLLWFQVAFMLERKRERFLQTMTALFGVNALFMPFVTPVLVAMLPYMEKPDPSTPPPAVMSLLLLMLGIWQLIALVRIVRAAFEWNYVAVVIFVLAQNFATLVIVGALFGVPAGKA